MGAPHFLLRPETWLGATGLACAGVSACFASYMLTASNRLPTFSGAEHLMIFAQPAAGAQASLALRRDPDTTALDMNATGTVRRAAQNPDTAVSTSDSIENAKILTGYSVHGVFGGRALVLGPQGLATLAIGETMPNGGRVLAIKLRDGVWHVVTTRGTIHSMP